MPFEVRFEELPSGYAVGPARPGERVTVCLTGFVSSEDGDGLITMLEGFPQTILSMLPLPAPILPSTVHTLLAVIRRDKTATVYLNDVLTVGEIRIKGSCQKGELIYADRILDVGRVEFQGVHIPPEAGIIYLFSVNWRKGYFYDLAPLRPKEGKPREYDLGQVLGSLYAYLAFQERFKIDENTWQVFFRQKWFPFVHLDNTLLREMISHAKEGWQIDDLLPKISAHVQRLLKDSPLNDEKYPVLAEHAEILATSVERYLAGDHISCASILYPRIEGLLRSFHRTAGYTSKPETKTLTKIAVGHHQSTRIANSLLLPAKFNEYLDTVYFAHFAPGSAPDIGRHSVAHGEARTDDFSLKATTIGFLVVYQLLRFFQGR